MKTTVKLALVGIASLTLLSNCMTVVDPIPPVTTSQATTTTTATDPYSGSTTTRKTTTTAY